MGQLYDGEHYVNGIGLRQKFYPRLDKLIDRARVIGPFKRAPRVLIKAYLITATNGSAYFNCDCCGEKDSVNQAAMRLNVLPRLLYDALASVQEDGNVFTWRFQIDPPPAERLLEFTQTYNLGEMESILLNCRIGAGMVSIWQAVQDVKHDRAIRQILKLLTEREEYQIAELQKQFDDELLTDLFNEELVCTRIRHGFHIYKFDKFGQAVIRCRDAMLHAGHTEEL